MRYVSNNGSTSPYVEVSESDFKSVIKKLDAKFIPGWRAAGCRIDGDVTGHVVGCEPSKMHNHGWLLHRDHLHLIECEKGYCVTESSDEVKAVCEKVKSLQDKKKIKEPEVSSVPLPLGNETTEGCDGMTLRDYFAAKAMQSILTNEAELQRVRNNYAVENQLSAIAMFSYRMADAMIEARSK